MLLVLLCACPAVCQRSLPAQAAGSAGKGQAAGSTAKKNSRRTGWTEENGDRYYLDADGNRTTGWKTIDGRQYYFLKYGKQKGRMAVGWKTIDGVRYYFETDQKTRGQMATGWKTIGGGRYYFLKSGKKRGRTASGWLTIDGVKYYFMVNGKNAGQMATGWKTIKGKQYYFAPSGGSAGQVTTGWKIFGRNCCYFGKNGVLNPKKTVNSSRPGDSTGSAATKTLRRAKAIVAQITTDVMTKEQKLRACFEYVMKYPGRRPRTPHYYGMDWPVVYANDMFLDGSGNCFSYAAAFAYLAKACGYTNVYACNDTGHGWTEINGLIYDPEEYRNTQHKYYGTSYSLVPGYRRGLSYGQAFAHVKI